MVLHGIRGSWFPTGRPGHPSKPAPPRRPPPGVDASSSRRPPGRTRWRRSGPSPGPQESKDLLTIWNHSYSPNKEAGARLLSGQIALCQKSPYISDNCVSGVNPEGRRLKRHGIPYPVHHEARFRPGRRRASSGERAPPSRKKGGRRPGTIALEPAGHAASCWARALCPPCRNAIWCAGPVRFQSGRSHWQVARRPDGSSWSCNSQCTRPDDSSSCSHHLRDLWA